MLALIRKHWFLVAVAVVVVAAVFHLWPRKRTSSGAAGPYYGPDIDPSSGDRRSPTVKTPPDDEIIIQGTFG